MSGHWCDTCGALGNEFCAGPCDCCGHAVHCNTKGRCAECESELMEMTRRAIRIRELIEDNRRLERRYSIAHNKRGN